MTPTLEDAPTLRHPAAPRGISRADAGRPAVPHGGWPPLPAAHNGGVDHTVLFDARARVLADLQARGHATAVAVSALEDAVSSRQWWAEQWPEGAVYVAGLVAQDVQDALLETSGRWPLCLTCPDVPPHALYISPDLGGPDPVWVCEETGEAMAPLGGL